MRRHVQKELSLIPAKALVSILTLAEGMHFIYFEILLKEAASSLCIKLNLKSCSGFQA